MIAYVLFNVINIYHLRYVHVLGTYSRQNRDRTGVSLTEPDWETTCGLEPRK
jgi:hypothetical protein